MRYTSGAILLLQTSILVAGTLGANTEIKSFELGGSALYLQPNTAFTQVPPIYITSAGTNLNTIADFPYAWGFKLEGSYRYTRLNDYTVNWYNFGDSSDSSSALNQPAIFVIPALGTVTFKSLNLRATKLDGWNAVNFELGKRFEWTDNDTVRFHGGAQYSRIKQSSQIDFSKILSAETIIVDIPDTPLALNATTSSVFNGFGPRFGVDLSRLLIRSLSVYAKGATALLAGKMQNDSYSTLTDNDPVLMNQPATTVAVNFDGRLGLSYDYALSQGNIVMDAGWLWVNYLNLNAPMSMVNTSFAIQGLYFGLKWKGDLH